ncbi:MAG TPA: DNA gyrase inhibitor YacG [Beijerinckiaceae bacterium]
MPAAPAEGAGRCPICGKPTQPASRPFCSTRCADVDLHRWLSGAYAVPVAEDEDGSGDAPSGEAGRA